CKLLGIPMCSKSFQVFLYKNHCFFPMIIYLLKILCLKTTASKAMKIIILLINVPIPAPTNSNLGKPKCPKIKIQLSKKFNEIALKEIIIAVLVYSNPSVNCFKAINNNIGIMDQLTN